MINMKSYLLSSVAAFANPGANAMARHKQTPSTNSLVTAVEMLEEQASTESEELLKRAPDSAAMVEYWDKTDAIVEGYAAIRAAKETYLPRFVDETNAEYEVRVNLTKFTNVYRDVVEGLASKPFEEEISIREDGLPEAVKDFAEDVDGEGNNLTAFASITFFNGINSAIDWIFVDYPTVDNTVVRTKADQKAAGIRPFWSHVLGRNVLEARTKNINGTQKLSYIRIFEPGSNTPDCVRIFELDDAGRVTWQLWEKGDKKKFYLIKDGVLSINVIPLVPFATGRKDGSTFKYFPAMQDAADLQIDLYQQESGLKFISTMAAYPMLAANGFRPELGADGKTPKKVAVGPTRVLWGIPDGNGNHGEWAYVEPSATSMKFLQEKIIETKQDLRELGRQPLTANSGNLTVITTAVAAGKARSAVAAWALALKDAIENAFLITAQYLNIGDFEPEVNVYNEFDNFTDGGADLTELGNARRAGDISRETYWYELKRRKVLSPEFEKDEETERLLNEIPGEPDLDNPDDNGNPVM